MEVKEHPPPSFLHKDRPPVLLSHSGTSPVLDWEEPARGHGTRPPARAHTALTWEGSAWRALERERARGERPQPRRTVSGENRARMRLALAESLETAECTGMQPRRARVAQCAPSSRSAGFYDELLRRTD
ncbi:unnamed protein product [Gadus morhua 'NCC']